MRNLIAWCLFLLVGFSNTTATLESQEQVDIYPSNATATLESLEQVDDHPLYTMTYYGSYEENIAYAQSIGGMTPVDYRPSLLETDLTWACSLFAAFADLPHALYGRNFDWNPSPALLLFTDPPDGYASVSMVDIEYLGFSPATAHRLTERSIDELASLLYAPYLPFDGMNEYGLVIGMAAVPDGNMAVDPERETADSLMIIRLMLDHARTVEEAIDIFRQYNIDWGGGPPIHYLVADATGEAVLLEFYEGELFVIPNQLDWHLATNHLRAGVETGEDYACWRYDRIENELDESEGSLTPDDAMSLLQTVSGTGTQWSIVYGNNSGEINVVMGRDYDNVHTFQLDLPEEE